MWKVEAIRWVGVIFIVAILFSSMTNGCAQVEQTSRVRAQLEIEWAKLDQMRLEKGLPAIDRSVDADE